MEVSCCLSVFSSLVVCRGPHNNCNHRKASEEIEVLDVAVFLYTSFKKKPTTSFFLVWEDGPQEVAGKKVILFWEFTMKCRGLCCVQLGHEPRRICRGSKTWKCTCNWEKSYNTDFICLSPWKYLSEMQNYLYDCFGDWSWRELGYIYVWASGGKTLCSVEINHFMPVPALRPPDWLSPR